LTPSNRLHRLMDGRARLHHGDRHTGRQTIMAGNAGPADLSRHRAFCYRCDEVLHVCFSMRDG
jgi:hypothetical protein